MIKYRLGVIFCCLVSGSAYAGMTMTISNCHSSPGYDKISRDLVRWKTEMIDKCDSYETIEQCEKEWETNFRYFQDMQIRTKKFVSDHGFDSIQMNLRFDSSDLFDISELDIESKKPWSKKHPENSIVLKNLMSDASGDSYADGEYSDDYDEYFDYAIFAGGTGAASGQLIQAIGEGAPENCIGCSDGSRVFDSPWIRLEIFDRYKPSVVVLKVIEDLYEMNFACSVEIKH
jgi:hypothetical protein